LNPYFKLALEILEFKKYMPNSNRKGLKIGRTMLIKPLVEEPPNKSKSVKTKTQVLSKGKNYTTRFIFTFNKTL
jgi:hypothetical protein